jgi:hypothetical protein
VALTAMGDAISLPQLLEWSVAARSESYDSHAHNLQ